MTREEAKDLLDNLIGMVEDNHNSDYDTALHMAIKALDREPRSGHWIGVDEDPHEDYRCSCCDYFVSVFTANIEPYTEYKYCPNCGAKMEG